MRLPHISSEVMGAVIALWKTGSYKQAGKELGLTPSAVYKRVKIAEDHFGSRLFLKTEYGVVLTDVGEILRSGATQMLEHALLVEERTAAFLRLQQGRLSVGHSTYLPPKLLAMVLKLEFEPPEGIRIRHFGGMTSGVVQNVIAGILDIGFGYLPLSHPDLIVYHLHEEPLIVCMPKDHPLAVRIVIQPIDLEGQPFVAVGRASLPALHQEIDEYFQQFGIVLRVVADAFAPPEALVLVEQRIGICLLGASKVTYSALIGKQLSTKVLTRKSGMFLREDNRHPTVRALVKLILEKTRAWKSESDRPTATKR
jgi:DNA-binding transcriptional LysR family regulator